MIAELAKVDSLPCAHVESAGCDRNGETDPEEGTLGVRRHVVRAFHGVFVLGFSLLHHVIQYGFHICTDVRIVIFVDG